MPVGQPPVYVLHGVRVRSPVPLAGFPHSGPDHDVDVRWTPWTPVPGTAPAGRVLASHSVDGRCLYVASVDGQGRYTLRVPGLCDFVLDRGLGSVECRLDPAADWAFVAVLVAGLVVAFLLSLGGHAVLHASAVEVDGRGIAFAGPSGTGKSTLAALLCAGGARLVTDDVLRVRLTPRIACVRGSPQLRLRPAASWALGCFVTPPAVRRTADARLGITPAPAGGDAALWAVVLPRLSRTAAAIEMTPVTGAAAVARLASVCRVGGWTDPGVLRSQFHAIARVAAGVTVVDAVIPWGRSSPAGTARAILGVVETVGVRR